MADDRKLNEPDAQHLAREVLQGAPSGYFVIVPQGQDEELVDLGTLLSIISGSWKLLLAATVLGAAIAAGISLLMTPLYQSQVLLAPVNQTGSGSGNALRNQLGGLAALAGIDVGSAGGRKEEALATLSSSGFARDFIVGEKLMPILFADRWDASAGRWRAGGKPPTLEDAVKKFASEVRSISEDRTTSLVSMTVEWRSPELAARWANHMVEMVNERMRNDATRNADRSIDYLNKELAKTNVVELRQAIYRLIEEQVNNAMMANVQREYAFRIIDPAVPAESRYSPKRTVMTIVGGVLGLFVGVVVVLLRHRLRPSQTGVVAAR